MNATVRLMALVAALCLAGGTNAAMAAPLLLVEGHDDGVIVLDLASRDRTGDERQAILYTGVIAKEGRPRTVTGERRVFDCPGRRERLVATLAPDIQGKIADSAVNAPWRSIAWKSALDYAAVAVCLEVYDRNRVSTKPDVPSILRGLEEVWKPGYPQPQVRTAPPPRDNKPWWKPF